jgi:hypothetical protein
MMKCPLKGLKRKKKKHSGNNHVKMEADIGVMYLEVQSKDRYHQNLEKKERVIF